MAGMISVETGTLRETAVQLNNASANCSRRLMLMQETIYWLRGQDFRESHELCRALEKQYEELQKQKNELRLLSEALIRISDKYEKAEQRITDEQSLLTGFKPLIPSIRPHILPHVILIRPCIVVISLLPVISLLKTVGIKIEE